MHLLESATAISIVFSFYMISIFCHRDSAEYCIVETFDAACSNEEIIVMTSAKYGFFGVGRCVKFDFGVNCSVNVMEHLDNACSWKEKCAFDVGKLYHLADTCLSQVTPYLLATYRCIAVETANHCRPGSIVTASGLSGSLSSSVARQSGCGTLATPWQVRVADGQTVKLRLVDIATQHKTESVTCNKLGYVFNDVSKTNTSFCSSHDDSQAFYNASGQSVKIQMIVDETSLHNYIIEYKVTGCTDLVAPDFAWYQRSGDDAMIGCQYRNLTWYLHCDGSRWNGVVGRCNDTTSKTTVSLTTPETTKGHQFLILIGIVAVVLLVIIICATVGILKLIDRTRARNAAKQQLLMEHSATLQYSRNQQRNVQPMYNERIEMVPDILESSLPRRQPHYPVAESESSYGTNYPGTMYYMGPNSNYSNYQQRHDYDSVTLPKKPETVSDSESEDMYATIPPY